MNRLLKSTPRKSSPKPEPKPFQEFRNELEHEILGTIRALKHDDVLGMSIDNLRQVTPTPRHNPGPKGTNAGYYYAEIFREVCESNNVIMRFII